MISALKQAVPKFGNEPLAQKITVNTQGKLVIPDHVIIPVIEGDGIGPEIVPEGRRVVDAAVKLAYGAARSIQWLPVIVGQKALDAGKKLIPDETLETLKKHYIFVKGPVDTPIGGGFRSVNVELRKVLDLFACVRPVKPIAGVVTPMKKDVTDVVIFRENHEDVYRGIEFQKGSPLARTLIFILNTVFPILNKILNKLYKTDTQYVADIREDSSIGIKPISETGSKRIIRAALQYAIDHNRPSVTLVGKANIMKFTEGAFFKWGEELAKQEFPGKFVTAEEFKEAPYHGNYGQLAKDSKILLQTRLTDAMLQDTILNPQWHSVIATMNLNGDYLSDAFAATVGGLGVAPGANLGDHHAMFESTHGSAPDIAGKGIANPTALFLTLAMMLDHMQWTPAADFLRKGIEKTLLAGKMTGDLAKKDPNIGVAKAISTKAYTDAVIASMKSESKPVKTSVA